VIVTSQSGPSWTELNSARPRGYRRREYCITELGWAAIRLLLLGSTVAHGALFAWEEVIVTSLSGTS
jgi:hypothetical protein